MRILVVDDEEDMLHLFRQEFRKEIREGKYLFDFAYNANEAIEFLDGLNPFNVFLVLSDINMPGLTGLELLKIIKDSRPELTIVIVTAYGDQSNYEASMENGASGFFVKPLDFKRLREYLSELEKNEP